LKTKIIKKTFIITALFLVATATKATAQSLEIINNTSCTVTVDLLAHSMSSGSCFSYGSNAILVPGSGGNVTYSTETTVNLSLCPSAGTGNGWQSTCYSAADLLTSGSYGWDGAVVYEPNYFSVEVGEISCGLSASTTATDCSNTIVTVTWQDVSGTITLTIN